VPYTADINEINAYVEQLRIENKFLPSDHLVKFIIEPFSQTSMRYLLLLLSTAIFSVALAYGIALGFYRKGWNCSFQSLSSGYKRRCSNVFYIILRVLKFPPRISALIVKDIRMFTRLPAQWGQSLIFFILLSTYIVSLRRTPLYEMVPLWFAIISFVNLGFTGYIVATLSARFVYPAISLEGRNISILLTSPLKRREFLREKFLISFIPNWLLAEFLIVFSNISLKSSVPFTLICAGITTVYALTIVSISMGLGALFPDFTESNPSKIAAGGGGILTAILSLFYIAIPTAIISLPTRRFISSQFQQEPMHSPEFVVYVLLFILVSILFSIVPLKAGMKSLRRMEI
jgi:ABC-2 type transport system permease protein